MNISRRMPSTHTHTRPNSSQNGSETCTIASRPLARRNRFQLTSFTFAKRQKVFLLLLRRRRSFYSSLRCHQNNLNRILFFVVSTFSIRKETTQNSFLFCSIAVEITSLRIGECTNQKTIFNFLRFFFTFFFVA